MATLKWKSKWQSAPNESCESLKKIFYKIKGKKGK